MTAYFTALGLRALIRDPASVRSWPHMQMSGFNTANLSDSDIDAVIAYLGRIAGTRKNWPDLPTAFDDGIGNANGKIAQVSKMLPDALRAADVTAATALFTPDAVTRTWHCIRKSSAN